MSDFVSSGNGTPSTLPAPERVACVGNRRGADLQAVDAFIQSLHAAQPDTILISGGAQGVDMHAENVWYRLGGRVRSYRPAPFGDGTYGIEIWNYSAGNDTSYVLGVEHQRVSFADYKSACLYRDWMIACDVDRVAVFYGAGEIRGMQLTGSLAKDREIPVYDYVAGAS